MHVSILDIVPTEIDALLLSFNELLQLFRKAAFRLIMKPRLHHLLVWVNQLAQTLRYFKSYCKTACADPLLMLK